MFFIDNFGDHGPNGRQYCFGWVSFYSISGMVFSSRFPTFLDHSFLVIYLQKEQKIRMVGHIRFIHGNSYYSICYGNGE